MENNTTSVFINSANFKGIVIAAPKEVILTQITQDLFIWDQSNTSLESTYSGKLLIEGTVQLFVPEGKQREMWEELNQKINFFVKDKKSSEAFKISSVTGGWNAVRLGVSSIGFMSQPAHEANEYYDSMPSNIIDQKYFTIDVFDLMPRMPKPETTLEIYAEYRGYTSNKILVKALPAKE